MTSKPGALGVRGNVGVCRHRFGCLRDAALLKGLGFRV